MSDALFAVGDFILIFGAVGALVFAVSYATFFQWRRTSAGRALMYFVGSLVTVFVNNTLARLWVDYPGREWVRLVVYSTVAWTIWRLVYVLWRNWSRREDPLPLGEQRKKENQS